VATNFTVVLAVSIPLCSNYSILIKPSNTTKYMSFVVFDGFISIL